MSNSYNKQIINNSIFSIIQIIIVVLCSFFLYKYIIETIGLEKLGLWSLILSVTSLASIGNFGFTGSLIKFSAELSVNHQYKKINAILNISALVVSVALFLILTIVYFLGYYFIGYFVSEEWVSTGTDLLFYALISLFINIIGALYFSVLEGLNMAYLKSLSFIITTIVYTILSVLFINEFDIMGLAYAQLCQSFLFLLLGIILSKTYIKSFTLFYFKWHKELMRKIFLYSLKFQGMGVTQLLYDPITKTILSKFGGLEFVAIFEMASKLVKQVRLIPARILINTVPKIVKLNIIKSEEKIKEVYNKINIINILLLFITVLVVIPFSKITSILIFDHVDTNFMIILIVLSAGELLASLSTSAYIINLGTGEIKWNIISHLVIGVLNLILCLSIGLIFKDGMYIIYGWIISLVLGSLVTAFEYHKRNNIPFNLLFNTNFFQALFYFLVFGILSYFINDQINNIIYLIIIQTLLTLLYVFMLTTRIKDIKQNIIYIIKTKRNELNS
tara:strand:- start:5908 stop:7419 length:1512 start_codon:yes stop_codon:yes gene_type:complete